MLYSRDSNSTPLPYNCVRSPISGLPERKETRSHQMDIGNSNKHCSVVLGIVLNIWGLPTSAVFIEKQVSNYSWQIPLFLELPRLILG